MESATITRQLFWLLIIQAVSYLILGVLVFLYPSTLFLLVAFTFVWTGLTTLYMAFRVRRGGEAIREDLEYITS